MQLESVVEQSDLNELLFGASKSEQKAFLNAWLKHLNEVTGKRFEFVMPHLLQHSNDEETYRNALAFCYSIVEACNENLEGGWALVDENGRGQTYKGLMDDVPEKQNEYMNAVMAQEQLRYTHLKFAAISFTHAIRYLLDEECTLKSMVLFSPMSKAKALELFEILKR